MKPNRLTRVAQIRVQRVILIQAGVRGFLVRRRMAKLRKKAAQVSL